MKKSTGLSKKNVAMEGNSGRIGNVRYYMKGEKTYTRTTTSNCSNPRTKKQMEVRIRLVNPTYHWHIMGDAIREYWEGVTPSLSAYNLFLGRAMHCQPIYLSKGIKCSIAAPYGVSQGTLPSIQYQMNEEEQLVTDIYLGQDFIINEKTTIGDFSTALTNNNDEYGYNDEIIFIGLVQHQDKDNYYDKLIKETVTLEKGSKVKLLDKVSSDYFASASDYLSTKKKPEAGCYAWIHLKRIKTGLKRFNQLIVKVSSQDLFNCNKQVISIFSSEKALESAFKTYGTRRKESWIEPKED